MIPNTTWANDLAGGTALSAARLNNMEAALVFWSKATSDTVNADVTANTLADAAGLSFAGLTGNTYWFRATIPFTSASALTGSRFVIDGPAATSVYYKLTLTGTSADTLTYANAYNLPATTSTNSNATMNMALIDGVVTLSASGDVKVRFSSETSASAITVKTGAVLQYQKIT